MVLGQQSRVGVDGYARVRRILGDLSPRFSLFDSSLTSLDPQPLRESTSGKPATQPLALLVVVDQSQLLLAQVVHLDARHHPRSLASIKSLHFRGSIDQFFVVGVGDLPQNNESMTGHHDPDPRLELLDDARDSSLFS